MFCLYVYVHTAHTLKRGGVGLPIEFFDHRVLRAQQLLQLALACVCVCACVCVRACACVRVLCVCLSVRVCAFVRM